MKKKIVLFLFVLFVSVGTIKASACLQPYSDAHVELSDAWFGKKIATARIEKCSCNPVDNYLSANIRIQHYNDDTHSFEWIPDREGYYRYDSNYNAAYSEVSIKEKKINYVDGLFYARCGDDQQITTRRELSATVATD